MKSAPLSLAFVALCTSFVAAQDELRSRPEGVSPAIEKAIERGLGYLRRVQSPDGSWSSSGRRGVYPTAMTSLAAMAFLGSGSTPTRGKHWLPVRRATSFLLSCSNPTGLITCVGEARPMYGHGFATMFLAQAYGMEEDKLRQRKIHDTLTRAVNLTAQSQSRFGGWIYRPDSDDDEGSVTITQVQALRACRNAGITVPRKTIDQAIGYIHKSANPDGGIRYKVTRQDNGNAPLSAAAVAVLDNAGNHDDPVAEKALKFATKHLPINGSGNSFHYYSQLYLAQALYRRGGDRWNDYYLEISNWLLGQQARDGSWNGDGVGPVYGTSVALTILQLPYSYVPIYQR